ncbi:guanine(37)-N1-methyltransferase, partial [Piromyces finnis]
MLAPPKNEGMFELDKKAFDKELTVTAIKIDVKKSSLFMKTLADHLLNMKRYQNIIEDPEYVPPTVEQEQGNKRKRKNNSPTKYILLSPDVKQDLSNLPEEKQKFIKDECMEIKNYTFIVDYEYWSTDDILRSIIPEEYQIPGSFETVGHIAHLNLREEYLPYKKIIGEIILDKNKHIKTVVNKTGKIDNTFRFFEMELLAGVWDMNAELKESNCNFQFDFSTVYWNSRLQGEHERLVKKFKKDEFICDVMAGVGPFALPAAKNKGSIVFANDLNPKSYEYLKKNVENNKLVNKVFSYNLDGRDFIKNSLNYLNDKSVQSKVIEQRRKDKIEAIRRKLKKHNVKNTNNVPEKENVNNYNEDLFKTENDSPVLFQHYVMNLPAIAIEFLDAFRGIFKEYKGKIKFEQFPTIHCHCFSAAEDRHSEIKSRVEAALGHTLDDKYIKEIYFVRSVAPNKDMYCISFVLPPEVAFMDEKESQSNKRKLGNEDAISE